LNPAGTGGGHERLLLHCNCSSKSRSPDITVEGRGIEGERKLTPYSKLGVLSKSKMLRHVQNIP